MALSYSGCSGVGSCLLCLRLCFVVFVFGCVSRWSSFRFVVSAVSCQGFGLKCRLLGVLFGLLRFRLFVWLCSFMLFFGVPYLQPDPSHLSTVCWFSVLLLPLCGRALPDTALNKIPQEGDRA
jgi:hypothetical protein